METGPTEKKQYKIKGIKTKLISCYQNKWPQTETTASLAVSRQILHSKLESVEASSPPFVVPEEFALDVDGCSFTFDCEEDEGGGGFGGTVESSMIDGRLFKMPELVKRQQNILSR